MSFPIIIRCLVLASVRALLLSVSLVAVTGFSISASEAKANRQIDDSPRLVIEAGGHQAVIRSLLFTADGKELISAGDDKTIRVWGVSQDGKTALLSRTIRGQIGDGRAGQIAAVALSSPEANGDQQWLAVGGFLSGSERQRNAIRIHDYASGEVRALLVGHTDNVLALVFSPSGHWLASAGKDKTIRIWDLATLQEAGLDEPPLILKGHTDRITGLAWSVTGDKLASASYDGTVGLWDTSQLERKEAALVARLKGHEGKVRSVAFHPDGTVLASGGQDHAIRLWQARDGESLGILAQAEHPLSALAFSPDGGLIVAGNFTPPKPEYMTLFTYPEGRTHQQFTGHNNLVIATAFHPSGNWLASAGGDHKEILLWRADTGEILTRLEGEGRTIYAVGFSKGGTSIYWGQSNDYASSNDRGPLEYNFDLILLERFRGGLSSSEAVRAQLEIGDLSLSTQKDGDPSLIVKRGRRKLCTIKRGAKDGYWHSAFTLSPDGQRILSGGQNGELRLYTIEGETIVRLRGHTGEIKAVSISADGHWALSGANDQTINLWDLTATPDASDSEIVPTITLFPAADGEWIAWTKEGYFAASQQGARLIGYCVNQGVSKAAEYVSIDQMYDRFYRPDLVQARLFGDPQRLWLQKGASTNTQEVISGGLAPRVAFVNPTTDSVTTLNAVNVQANVIDQGGGIGKIVWKINDTTVATDSPGEKTSSRLAKADGQIFKDVLTLQQKLELLPGDNTIELLAYNHRNEIASSPAVITLTVSSPKPLPLPKTETPPLLSKIPEPAIEAQPPPPDREGVPPAVAVTTIREADTIAQQQPSTDTIASISPTLSVSREAGAEPSPVSGSPAQNDKTIGRTIPEHLFEEKNVIQPTLHLLVVCINRYRDKALQLKYAVSDGRAIAEIVRQTGSPLFRDVRETLLFDDQVTVRGLERAFRTIKGTIAPQDVFMFYLAGHGVTLDGRYYFLPHDFRYYNEDAVREKAINQDHLQDWLAVIPARKSLVLIDTCESGSFSHSMVAMRGMAEKAAISKLTRATGRATIVASTEKQPAAEGYQGHGVFTYVLIEGLRHADSTFGNRDGYTGLFELASYINDQVPAITMNAFNFEQIPQVHMVGTDFPIGVVNING